jgi:hypothetical protein
MPTPITQNNNSNKLKLPGATSLGLLLPPPTTVDRSWLSSGLSNPSDNPLYLHHGGRHHALRPPPWPSKHPNTITSPTPPSNNLYLSLDSADTCPNPPTIAKADLFRRSQSPPTQKQMTALLPPTRLSHPFSQALLMHNIICKMPPPRELVMAVTCLSH